MPKVHVEIAPSGMTKMLCVSTTEDLWHDFEYFKQRANELNSFGEDMLRRRYIRAAISAIYAYLEGVVNDWYAQISVRNGDSPESIKNYIRYTCLEKKCDFITRTVIQVDATFSSLSGWVLKSDTSDGIAKPKDVRNAYSHPKPENDFELFNALSKISIHQLETTVVTWLDSAASALRFPRHIDTSEVLGRFEFVTKSGSAQWSDSAPSERLSDEAL
jgi:hypothetical protein